MIRLYIRDLEITPQEEMHLEVDHYLTPIEITDGWISVGDLYPEQGSTILTKGEYGLNICDHRDGIFRYHDLDAKECKGLITHWTPILPFLKK